jgi:hypothetical protein
MARKGRIEFPGAVYHVLDRGDRREPVVRSDKKLLHLGHVSRASRCWLKANALTVELEKALREKMSENHRVTPFYPLQ